MRRILCLTLAVFCAAPATAAALSDRQLFGIGAVHQREALNSPRLLALEPESTRMLADWNVAVTDGWEAERIDAWYQAAVELGIRPLLSFQGLERRPVPKVGQYRRAVRAAMKRWPRIREWQVWNEANHRSQPATYNRPRLAARYARAFERVRCRRCTVVPISIVLSDSPRTRRWIARFLDEYGRKPKIWALHNYGDVNRGTDTRMRSFLRRHPSGRIWITETGGFARYINGWSRFSLRRQARVARYAFRQARRFRARVDRMYWWEWQGSQKPRRARWDTGLVNANGTPRPAYRVAMRQRFRG